MTDPRAQDAWGRVSVALSVALPLVLYIATAAPGPYWLDSGELATGAYLMGIPHPPGHPLYTALVHPASLVPLGSIALRMNIMSGVFGALSCGALAWTCRRILNHLGTPSPWGWIAGTSGALLAATSYAFWFQSVRAEVYTLHLLVASVAVGLAVEMEAQAERPGGPDTRLAYVLALVLGLGAANHHYLVVFVSAPIVIYLALRGVWRRALLGWAGARAVGFGLVGLMTYALLPVRAARDPLVNWGDPDTPADFVWVVTAQAFQKALGKAEQVDGGKLVIDLFTQVARQTTPVGLVLFLSAMVWLARQPRGRTMALLLGGGVVANLTTQSLFNFDPFNPDVHGYFALTAWTLALGVGVGIGAFVRTARTVEQAWARRALPLVAAAAAVALIGVNAALTAPDARLDGFRDVDLNNVHLLEPLPPGSVVFTSNYKTIFNTWYARGVERRGPSLTVVHRNFLSWDSYVRQIRVTAPEVVAVAEAPGSSTRLNVAALRALAATRPVFLEFDVNVQPDLEPLLVPDGLLFRVMPNPVPRGPLPAARREQQMALWMALERSLRRDGTLELETGRHLLWQHYLMAVGLTRSGHDELASFHLRRALLINPASPELAALGAELSRRRVQKMPP